MGITQVIDRLDSIEKSVRLQAKDILTIDEAAIYTGFSKAHLYRLTCEHRIPHYKRDSRLCFDKQELRKWMTEVRIATDSETEQQAQQYINHTTKIV